MKKSNIDPDEMMKNLEWKRKYFLDINGEISSLKYEKHKDKNNNECEWKDAWATEYIIIQPENSDEVRIRCARDVYGDALDTPYTESLEVTFSELFFVIEKAKSLKWSNCFCNDKTDE